MTVAELDLMYPFIRQISIGRGKQYRVDGEDVAHTAYVRARDSLHNYRPQARGNAARAWLSGIVHHVAERMSYRYRVEAKYGSKQWVWTVAPRIVSQASQRWAWPWDYCDIVERVEDFMAHPRATAANRWRIVALRGTA